MAENENIPVSPLPLPLPKRRNRSRNRAVRAAADRGGQGGRGGGGGGRGRRPPMSAKTPLTRAAMRSSKKWSSSTAPRKSSKADAASSSARSSSSATRRAKSALRSARRRKSRTRFKSRRRTGPQQDAVSVSLKDATIPHEVYSTYGGAKILLRPASPGTGIIAGKTVRSVLESAGIKDILTKSLGSKNAANVVKATLERAVEPPHPRADLPARAVWKSKKWPRRKLPKRWRPD